MRTDGLIDRLLIPFGRVTSGGGFVPEIDGLRFVAIGVVIMFHLNGYLTALSKISFISAPQNTIVHKVASLGDYGVHLFFIISGFILAIPFARHHLQGSKEISLKRYFMRRLTRLEPPYLLNLAIFTVLLVMVKGQSISVLLPHLVASVFYQHNFIYGQGSLINAVAWSLEIEVQFYILVPFLTRIFMVTDHARRRLFIVLIALAVPTAMGIMPAEWLPGMTVLNYLQYFLMGFLLADLFIVTWKMKPNISSSSDLLAIFGWPIFFVAGYWARHGILLARVLQPFGALMAYVAAFRGPLSRAIFRSRWIVTIGGMCYSIYLYHYLLISVIGKLTLRFSFGRFYAINYAIQLAIVGTWVIVVCAILFRLFERPFMQRDWPRQLFLFLRHRQADQH